MTINWLFILVGLGSLFLGGELLVKGSAALAIRLGVPPLVTGLTVVAFGTSSPELLVSLQAALQGGGAIAAGNVIGSNIFNVGCILGLTGLFFPVPVRLQILRFDAPILLGFSTLLPWVLTDGMVSRVEGVLLSAGLIGYAIATIRIASRQKEEITVTKEFEAAMPKPTATIWVDMCAVIGGLGLLIIGSRFLVAGAVNIARELGVTEAVIGLTIVATGTSLPELAACLVAGFRKQPDIVLGNIVGSNIFNLLGILGISAAVRPFAVTGIMARDIVMMIALAAALMLAILSRRLIERWEGVVLLAAYAGYLWHLIQKAGGH